MKKAYIIGILMIVAGIGYLISATSDVSTYANFSDAKSNSKVKVSGFLIKNKPIVYDPNVDANLTTFFMEDQKGESMKVIYQNSKPQDFEMSESLVVTGKLENDIFYASDILLKCPSKYKDQEVMLRKNE
ncbi:cytochrome c maturation protein CcmE domain-containing protein [Portibacter lacus]|uniref:Cytochrome C biogenesis protein CcmE n=1 Tax=Portibacter lacus TaxID=1099794 RepID=A0AA37SND2_9BACT|nr:cytochrome c maturation protein CcmE [Portibacter lacus]GLR16267.1 cytochrome C biogenesis protein CcmE [Portibacter lacus]